MPTLTASQISVRRLRDEDEPLLVQMYEAFTTRDLALGLPPRDPVRRQAWLASVRPGANLVAVAEGRIAGHLVLMRVGHSAEMALFVHPDFRRQGIATALTQAAVGEVRTQGAWFLWVLISSNNSAARTGLLKFGFHTNWEGLGEAQMVYRL